MSRDAHLRTEISGACRGLSFLLEALRCTGCVHIYRHMGAELLQLARVVTRDAAVRGPGARLAGTGRQEVPGCIWPGSFEICFLKSEISAHIPQALRSGKAEIWGSC